MAEVRYGHVEGPGQGREYPMAASQYFHRRGGKFVYMSSGNANLCASGASGIEGWAEVPKHTTGFDSWKSSATAGKDKVFVVYGLNDVFEIPFHGTASALLIGLTVGIVNATNATVGNATPNATSLQQAKYGSTASPLEVVDVDTTNNTVFVKIRPTGKQ